MLRDQIKDKNFFDRIIANKVVSNKIWISKCENGEIKDNRVSFVKRNISWTNLTILSARYSAGYSVEELVFNWKKSVKLIHESWDGFWKLKQGTPPVEHDQYILSAYDEMLWMLSLGYLLDIEEADFKKLAEVIDRDGVKDYLFEFIIRAKLKDRQPITEESYREFFGIPDTFKKLRQAITETNKTKAENLIKEFITKDWYKNHKDAGWYNSHKSKHDTYFGYWSFETAAVVAIMNLDDSSFRDCQYYPKDLVDFFRENKNT
ncbi:DUF1911 domain-containing protein [Galbibacter sp. EGI 63066]|uniref:PoNe immunity protein domain-containing protein n=1 Tax=Galbibacter sp. EGI 63066 TaxID=2993559 RepID=UPI00224964D9|nr:PoNe immunity protein domain-containing protein [Galbibacter sp. EGI 63066]MCX2682107.1 DUF1911 domain-containing protein [Galbibacter sp. EGI 63066]